MLKLSRPETPSFAEKPSTAKFRQRPNCQNLCSWAPGLFLLQGFGAVALYATFSDMFGYIYMYIEHIYIIYIHAFFLSVLPFIHLALKIWASVDFCIFNIYWKTKALHSVLRALVTTEILLWKNNENENCSTHTLTRHVLQPLQSRSYCRPCGTRRLRKRPNRFQRRTTTDMARHHVVPRNRQNNAVVSQSKNSTPLFHPFKTEQSIQLVVTPAKGWFVSSTYNWT